MERCPMFIDWRFDTVRMAVLLKLIYRFNAIPTKISANVLWNWQADPKVHTEIQGIQESKNNFERKKKKRTKLEDSHFLISKLITKFIRNPDSVELYQNRHVNQQNKTENPKIKPFTVNWLFTREPRQFNEQCGTTGQPHAKEWSCTLNSHHESESVSE